MVKSRAGQRIRKKIGFKRLIDPMRATHSEIKEDLRSMGINLNPSKRNITHKISNFPKKKRASTEKERAAIDGLTKLIVFEVETSEVAVLEQDSEQLLPMISQRYKKIWSEDIDTLESKTHRHILKSNTIF